MSADEVETEDFNVQIGFPKMRRVECTKLYKISAKLYLPAPG